MRLNRIFKRFLSSQKPKDVYTHGHSKAVVNQHASRRLETSCQFLLPSLKPGMKVLDVGCGPGTITQGFVEHISPSGSVVGVDSSKEIIKVASEMNQVESDNLSFKVADIYELPFDDDSFDIVHAHQVLQHLSNPILAVSEMRRVTKPGGVVASRESDYITMRSFPIYPGIELWREKYFEVCYKNNAEPRAGIHLKDWYIRGGFDKKNIQYSCSVLVRDENIDVKLKKQWGNDWVERALHSSFAKQAIEYGVATQQELEAMAADWKKFADNEEAIFSHTAGEVIATK